MTGPPMPILMLDPVRRAAGLAGEAPQSLRAKSFAALDMLARHAPDVVSKDLLADGVWCGRAASDDSIAQVIHDIRRALHDTDRSVIQTVPGVGYRLFARTLDAVVDAPSSTPPALAVLPFEALTEDARWHRFARGLTVDVASDLTRSSACSVLSPTLLAPRDGSVEAKAIDYGRLGARWVVTGTLQCDEAADPPLLKVVVTMLEADAGAVVWSRRWEEPTTRFFQLQDRIVAGIVNEIASLWSGRLAVLTERGARDLPTASLGAYEHFQCGVIAAGLFTPEGFTQSVRHFEAALALDPEYGDAWSTLAIVYGIMSAAATGDELSALAEARLDAARRAFAHRPRGAWAHLSGAWVAAWEGDEATAGTLIREAVSLAPHDADLHGAASGYAALVTDLYDEAEEWGARALELNALAPDWYHFPIGYARFFRGNPAGALAALRQGPQTYAELLAFRAACEAELDRPADAASTVRHLTELYPDFSSAAYVASEPFSAAKAKRLLAAFARAGLPG